MKKLIQIITASIVSVGLMAGTAAADTVNCGNITNTGPDSTNTITCVDINSKQVTCNNNNKVVESNDQNANSGDSFTVNNTNSGNSNSGGANNSNTVTVNLGDSCAPQVANAAKAAATTTPAAATPAATPAVTSAKAPAPKAVAALPETGSNSIVNDSAITVAVLGGAIAASQLGVMAYRRLALK